jgi:hypothetical protein
VQKMRAGPSHPAIRSWMHRCKLLPLKAVVVSVAERAGPDPALVRLGETSESKPSMKGRKRIVRCRNRGHVVISGQAWGGDLKPGPSDVRLEGGRKSSNFEIVSGCADGANSMRARWNRPVFSKTRLAAWLRRNTARFHGGPCPTPASCRALGARERDSVGGSTSTPKESSRSKRDFTRYSPANVHTGVIKSLSEAVHSAAGGRKRPGCSPVTEPHSVCNEGTTT